MMPGRKIADCRARMRFIFLPTVFPSMADDQSGVAGIETTGPNLKRVNVK
jgi:hypothetical protein